MKVSLHKYLCLTFYDFTVVWSTNFPWDFVTKCHRQRFISWLRYDVCSVALSLKERLADDLILVRVGGPEALRVVVALLDEGPLALPGGGVVGPLLEYDFALLPVEILALLLLCVRIF